MLYIKGKIQFIVLSYFEKNKFIQRQEDVIIALSIINSSIEHLPFTYSVAGIVLDSCCPMTSISYMRLLSTQKMASANGDKTEG